LYGLERHLHLIRSLEIRYQLAPNPPQANVLEERFKTKLTGCQGLTQLSTDVFYEDLFMMLDKNRETITRFGWLSSFGESQDLHVTQRLWDVLGDDTDAGSMRHLKHLELWWVIVQAGDGHSTLRSAFTKLCQRLETLELSFSLLSDWPVSTLGFASRQG
jgi:hypothetical protein